MIADVTRTVRRGIHALDIDVLPVVLFIVPVVAPVLFLIVQRSVLAFVTF